MRRAGALTLAVTALCAIAPAGASAEISCGLYEGGPPGASGDSLSISASTPELDVVAVQRSGDEIVVSNDTQGAQVPCAFGTPTVTSIDTIAFAGADATSLVIDLRGGQFAPGATPAPLGPEIEWHIDWALSENGGFLVVNSAPGTDAIGFGQSDELVTRRANLNRAFEDPWDAEVLLAGLQTVYLRGDDADEFLSTAGSYAPFNEFTGPLDRPASLDGGGGKDMLHGGAATDLIDGGGGRDNIVGGLGKDDIVGGGGADFIDVRDGVRDHVNCGSGRDKVREDPKDKLLKC